MKWYSARIHVYAKTPSFSFIHSHPYRGYPVSEGVSCSTFPLHQSGLRAASASPGLPRLAVAGDLLTWPLPQDCVYVCTHERVFPLSKGKQLTPTDMLLFIWHAWTNSSVVCSAFGSSRCAARASHVREVRVVIHFFSVGFFFFSEPEILVLVTTHKFIV